MPSIFMQTLQRAAHRSGLAATGAALLIAGGAAHAAEPLPAAAFFKRPAVLDVQLSPSGRRLAVSAELKGRVGLFVADLQSADFAATAVALAADADVRGFKWVDDERLVFSLVDLQDGLGEDYRVAPGLAAVRFDGSELRPLVARGGPRAFTSGGRFSKLPWNHRLLHVPAASEERGGARADEVIVGEFSFDRGELSRMAPKWLDTRSGRTRVMAVETPPAHALRWWFSPQGLPRAVLAREGGQEALHWYHLPHDGLPGRWELLVEAPVDRLPYFPSWVGSGDTLYVEHRVGAAGEKAVSPFDFATGRPGTPLVVAPGFDVEGELIGDPDGKRLLGVRLDADSEQTVWFDPARKALQQRVDEALPGRVNRITCRRCDAADAVVLVRSWSDRDPGELLLFSPGAADEQGRWKRISTVLPGIDPERMATVDLVRIRARDGRDLPVWVTRPAGAQTGQPLPAVVLVHGGPWLRNGHWRWDAMPQFLASRGYVVIEPEFRGSDGYGALHLRAGDKQFGQAMQDDVADALRWAQQKHIASDKACIAGGSYGGYSVLMGLIRDPELYRCGSAWSAVADLLLFVQGQWYVSDDINGSARTYALPARVGDPDKDRAMLLAHSPVEQAARIQAPLQLIWGRDDLRVPITHGERLRAAMQKAGREPEWIVYEGEAHGLRKTENQVDRALKLEAFLARYLK